MTGQQPPISANRNAGIRSNKRLGKQVLSCSTNFIKQLTTRTPMEQLHEEIHTRHVLREELNWVQLTGIGLGAIIGAGIFELSGQAAAIYSGPAVIISFIISGIVALLSALSFAEMAAMMPLSGAAYTYTYAALGEYAAWFIGWNYALLYQLGALTVVVGWSKYVVSFINLVSNYNATNSIIQAPVAWDENTSSFFVTHAAINLPAIAITLAITVLLVVGIRPTAMVNLVLVVIKIIILLIFIFATCKYVDRDNYTPFFPPNQGSFSEFGVTGMLQACTYVFFAYVGFDSVATVAEEAKSRTRPVPYATIASVVISLLIYIGICTVMVGLVPYKSLDVDNPLSVAIKATPYGLWLLILMDLGAISGLTTVALTVLLSQTRIFYAMAHDGLLPAFFAKIHPQTETPWISTIISGVFCAVTSGIFPLDIVGETTSISALVTYLFVHIDVTVMRYTHKNMDRPFEVPFGHWLIPTLGSLLCILLMKGISKETGYRYLVWTGLGQVVYFSYGFWHSKKRQRQRAESLNSAFQLLPTVERLATEYTYNGSELNSIVGTTEDDADRIVRF